MTDTTPTEMQALAGELQMIATKLALLACTLEAERLAEPAAMLGGVNGVSLMRHIKGMADEVQRQYHTPLYEHPKPPEVYPVTKEELVEIGRARGYKDPEQWATHVLVGRQQPRTK